MGTCLGLTIILALGKRADQRTEVDWTELFDIEPWLDELTELFSELLVVSLLL